MAGAHWLTAQPAKAAKKVLELSLVSSSLNFGEAWETEQFRWPLEFENRSTQPIRIERFDTGCDCAKVNVERLEIPPGDRRTVTATLDLTRHRPGLITGVSWPDRFPLKVEWADGAGRKGRAGWLIRGNVKALVDVEPKFIWFGDQLLKGTAGESHKLKIHPCVPLNDLIIASQPDGFTCTLNRIPNGYELTVVPTDRLPAGFISRDLKLSLFDTRDNRLPAQTVTIFGTVNEKVVVLPEAVNFGPVRIGENVVETIAIASRTGEPFEMIKIETPLGTTILGKEKTETGWRIRIRQQVAELGNHTATAKIQVRLNSGEVVTLLVSFTWCGVAAQSSTPTGS